MRTPMRSLVALVGIIAGIAAAPAAAEAKCRESLGHPVRPGYVLIVDGRLVGEYAAEVQPAIPMEDELLSLQYVCIEAPQEGARHGARQVAVTVITRRGFPDVAKRYLSLLVEAQEAHRRSQGRYAADLATLDAFDADMTVPIDLQVGPQGWSASAGWSESGVRCEVYVGYEVTPRWRQSRGAARAAGSILALETRPRDGVPFCR